MQNVKTVKTLLCLITICSMVCPGCAQSKKTWPSRAEAKEIIIKDNPYPFWVSHPFPVAEIVSSRTPMYQYLTQGGYVTMNEKSTALHVTYTMSLTDKAMPYYLETRKNPYSLGKDYWMITYVEQFKEVTGITFSPTTGIATVEYMVTLSDVTPFGKARGYYNGDLSLRVIRLVKSDSGWSIKRDPY